MSTATSASSPGILLGAALGVVAFFIPFVRFVLSYLNVLVHEFGHSATAWALGYPSVPAFDWRYGGGVAIHGERSMLVMFVIGALFLWRLVALAEHPGPRNRLLGLGVLYVIVLMTPLDEALRLSMGHGMELIIAGVFLFRALTGEAIIESAERPLYAMCGVFMLICNASLAWGLMHSDVARDAYGMQKGGGHVGDLSRLAKDVFYVPLELTGAALFLATFLTPIAAYVVAARFDARAQRAAAEEARQRTPWRMASP
ncbi:MAG: hypothetical protein AAGN46_05060 [Acidobacteriota bacterium]